MADLPPLSTSDTRGSISAVPMHEVEPSPVDNEEYGDDASLLPRPATSSSKASSTTNWLGLTPSRTIHILSSLQKYSVIPFSAYLTMHYTNTAIIPALFTSNAREADKYLLLTRPYYQSEPLEPLLIFLPVLTHVASGIALRIYRRRLTAARHGAETHKERKKIPYAKPSLTSVAGFVLYPMFVLHMLSMRVTPKKVDGSSASVGLRYFAHGISSHPWIGVPTHAFLIATASYHVVTGAAKFLRLSKEYITEGGEDGRVKKLWRGRIINGTVALVAGVWMYGALGVVGLSGKGAGWEASHWDAIYKQVPLVGKLF